jgi:hypothetical protein
MPFVGTTGLGAERGPDRGPGRQKRQRSKYHRAPPPTPQKRMSDYVTCRNGWQAVTSGIHASFQAEVFRAALRDPFEPALHDRRVAISQRLRQVFSKRGRNVLARVAGVHHRGVALARAVDAIQQVDGVLARVLLDQRLDAVPALPPGLA